MRRLLSILAAPLRLALAVRRHGLSPVASFLVLNLRRRGLGGAVHMALARCRARADFTQAEAALRSFRLSELGAPDLDATFAMPAARWEKWISRTSTVVENPAEPVAEALYIVRGQSGARGAFAHTMQTIRRAGSAQVVEVEDGTAFVLPPAPPSRFVVFLRAGDTPRPELAREIARVAREGVADVVSFDLTGRRNDTVLPLLAPGANPTLLRAVDYLFGRAAMRAGSIRESPALASADPRALIIDWMAGLSAMQVRGRWRHVGRPLIDTTMGPDEIEAHVGKSQARGRRPPPPTDRRVSVVVCTRDRGHLLRQLMRNLLDSQGQVIAEVVVVANGTSNPYAQRTLEDVSCDPRVHIVHDDGDFNFSRLSNTGARTGGAGSHLLFLNDDIAPVSDNWIAHMLARFDDPAVGAVGPLLLYPDERVQHAGMYLGFGGIAGHTLRHARLPDEDYLFTCNAPRETSAVTGAAMMVSRAAFDALNGFDAQLATYLQDVDLCLRLHRSGFVNVFDPSAVLMHMESVSIRPLEGNGQFQHQRRAERSRFMERWGGGLSSDPYHPAELDLQDESLRRLATPGARPLG